MKIFFLVVVFFLEVRAEPEPQPYRVNTCGLEQTQCSSGLCIPTAWLCDGDDDCPDGDDELSCASSRDAGDYYNEEDCLENEFQCNGSCIASEKVCDGHVDCEDGSDEGAVCFSDFHRSLEGTTPRTLLNYIPSTVCPPSLFQCPEGCIHESLVCDGHSDCRNGEDEGSFCGETFYRSSLHGSTGDLGTSKKTTKVNFKKVSHLFPTLYNGNTEVRCPSGQYSCSGQCVPGHQFRCDGKEDCLDGTDEIGCVPTPPTTTSTTTTTTTTAPRFQCPVGTFSCATDKQCYPASERCNNRKSCRNGADEHACPQTTTAPPVFEFQCGVGDVSCGPGLNQCYRQSERCNGVRKCRNGADELNCALPRIVESEKCDGTFTCKYGFCYKTYLTDCEWEFRCRGRFDGQCAKYHTEKKLLKCIENCLGPIFNKCPEPTTTTTTTTTTPPPRWIHSCESEYFQLGDRCISIEESSTYTWSEARSFCKETSARMVEITTANFFLELVALLNQTEYSRSTFYVGANDIDKEGAWIWDFSKTPVSMGTPYWGLEIKLDGLEENKLFEQQPNGGKSENCALLGICPSRFLSDVSCQQKHSVICEKDLTRELAEPRKFQFGSTFGLRTKVRHEPSGVPGK